MGAYIGVGTGIGAEAGMRALQVYLHSSTRETQDPNSDFFIQAVETSEIMHYVLKHLFYFTLETLLILG